jgi:hypothetical protein
MIHSLFDRIAGLFRDIREYGGLTRQRVSCPKNFSGFADLAKA